MAPSGTAREFYSIAPAHALAEFMGGATPPTSDQPLIYRASDVDVLDRTAVLRRVRSPPVVGQADQRPRPVQGAPTRVAAQAPTAAAIATLELEVAMIADFEFFSAEVDPAGALLNRLNVVDGIFSEQVGVAITASELKVFDNPADPFTTSRRRNAARPGRYVPCSDAGDRLQRGSRTWSPGAS